jgi:hypothetical protein
VITDLVQIRRLGEQSGTKTNACGDISSDMSSWSGLRLITEDIEDIDCKECQLHRSPPCALKDRVAQAGQALRLTEQKFLNQYAEMTEDEG